MRTKIFNEEVLFVNETLVKISRGDLESLKGKAVKNTRRRIRLCMHKGLSDKLHEMFIIHARNAYVRPHKHLNKCESLYVINGLADAVLFDAKGKITDLIRLGDYSSGNRFYYRISKPVYHCLIIRSKFFIFHEVTKGPFKRSDTIFAPWAPDENDRIAVKKFMKNLVNCIEIKLGRSKRK